MKPIVIIDPGHGMGNRRAVRYDCGAVSADGKITEAEIVMSYANIIRDLLRSKKIPVVRTRIDDKDPAPVSQRARIARDYHGTIMISLHCNAANGRASGTETYYRGEANKPMAAKLNLAVCQALSTGSRGVKTEKDSQHGTLAVMNFQPCFLIELGFIDHSGDLTKMLNHDRRQECCRAIVNTILEA